MKPPATMTPRGIHLKTPYRVCWRRAFAPLILSSVLACAILVGRIHFSQSWNYAHMVWNLFLAWIPFLCSGWVAELARRGAWPWRSMLPAALWLLFLPNAPYMVTDFVHLHHSGLVPLWYDIGLLAMFAWTGCFLAVASLRTMHMVARPLLGNLLSWLFILCATGLSGFGVYLGRFLRWNSWDLLFDPRGVLSDVVARVINPGNHPQAVGVTLVFTALLLVCYLTFMGLDAEHGGLP